ncbi:MAG: MBL fold metallo-hydrolase [Candidatus Kryptoniota bacterium]
MKIKFWGVRGSIATPGASTVRYGGNTACTELRLDDGSLIILDAGTGIRTLGDELMQRNETLSAHILITHLHWDHIQGFPFFKPAFVAGNELTIVGPEAKGVKLAELIAEQMNKIYFPVKLSEVEAKINFIPIKKEDSINIQGAYVQSFFVNHPGFTLGYRITQNDKTLVYISDNEPVNAEASSFFINREAEKPDLSHAYHGDLDKHILEFVKGADVLIHDATYTPEQYDGHIGWGHSDYLHALFLASGAGVKNLFLFHYDPSLDDKDIDDIIAKSNIEMRKLGCSYRLYASKEGLEFEF